MIKFTARILQFEEKGEKTGWMYIDIPADLATQLKPGNKKSFRVKGKLDQYPIQGVALVPMGGGDFIMAINASMRKGTGKRKGAQLSVQLAADDGPLPISPELLQCLDDDAEAFTYFKSLAPSHQLYFSRWIESAKTEPTKTKRLTQAVIALSQQKDYGTMIRGLKGRE